MSNFAKDMLKTFAASTLGCITSNVIQSGLSGSTGAPDFIDLALGGMQCGVDFIAYPIAVNIVAKLSPKFKKNMEDPKGCKIITYVIGGAATAVLGTLLKYPIQKAQAKQGEKFCIKEVLSNMVDAVGGSIGFAATINTVAPLLPAPINSLHDWAQGHLLVHIANLGASLAAYPVAHIRYGVSLPAIIGGWKDGLFGTMCTGDAMTHFKALM